MGRKNSTGNQNIELIEEQKAEINRYHRCVPGFFLECYLYAPGSVCCIFQRKAWRRPEHMKQVHPEYLLIGELPGPVQVRALTMKFTTVDPERGLVRKNRTYYKRGNTGIRMPARREILTGSLVNARQLPIISAEDSEQDDILAMRKRRRKDCKGGCDCAQYIKCLLEADLPYRRGNMVLKTAGGEHFFNPIPRNLSSGGFLA